MSVDLLVLTNGDSTFRDMLVVSGVQLLGQKFMIELLTERGSMHYLPTRGCNFLARIRRRARNEFDVSAAFAAAKNQIQRTLRGDEGASTPADERYAGGQLNKIIMDDGTLSIDFLVKSRAGSVVRMLTPPIKL